MFSLDAVITAVGMADHVVVMVVAVVIAMIIMLVAAEPVSRFVNAHPSVKMLALSFLLLIGIVLVADGLGYHVPRGYLHFAISFSALVEGLDLWAASGAGRRRPRPPPPSRSRGANEPPRFRDRRDGTSVARQLGQAHSRRPAAR